MMTHKTTLTTLGATRWPRWRWPAATAPLQRQGCPAAGDRTTADARRGDELHADAFGRKMSDAGDPRPRPNEDGAPLAPLPIR